MKSNHTESDFSGGLAAVEGFSVFLSVFGVSGVSLDFSGSFCFFDSFGVSSCGLCGYSKRKIMHMMQESSVC